MTDHFNVVRVKGLEPPRQRRQNLNLVRLPIPPHPHPGRLLATARGGMKGKNSMRQKKSRLL